MNASTRPIKLATEDTVIRIDSRCELVADGLLRISDASTLLGLSRSKLY